MLRERKISFTNKLDKLYQDAYDNNVIVLALPLESVESMIQEYGESAAIALNITKLVSHQVEVYFLDHEMAHYHTGTYYTLCSPLQRKGKMEHLANTWMVCDLVPIDEMYIAFKKGYSEVWDLAEYFNVPENVIRTAAEIYMEKGFLKPFYETDSI